MNKIKLGLIALVLVGLVGCSSGTKTTTCSLEKPSINIKYTYESDSDKIKVMTIDQAFDRESIDMSDEELEANIDEYKDFYNVDGVTYKATIEKDKIKEIIKVDMDKADVSELTKVGLADDNEDGKATYLSLKKTIEGLENEGAKCEK